MTPTTALYLVDVLDHLHWVLFGLLVLSAATFITAIMAAADGIHSEVKFNLWCWFKGCALVALISLIGGSFIPSKQTMYLMLGANYLQQSDIPEKVSTAINLKLDEYIKELGDKK